MTISFNVNILIKNNDGRIWRKSNTVRKMNRDGGRRNSDSCLNKTEE